MGNHTTSDFSPKLCRCGCGKPVKHKSSHYLQGHNSKYPDITPEERFWKFVARGRFDECWPWQGATRNGYGVLNIDHRATYAHRFSYELHHGPLADGMTAMHQCDNPLCVNPYHLSAGTKGDNLRDMYAKGRGRGGAQKGAKPKKITADQVREIRTLASEGTHYPAIAKRYGLSVPGISMIVTRKRWPHVT